MSAPTSTTSNRRIGHWFRFFCNLAREWERVTRCVITTIQNILDNVYQAMIHRHQHRQIPADLLAPFVDTQRNLDTIRGHFRTWCQITTELIRVFDGLQQRTDYNNGTMAELVETIIQLCDMLLEKLRQMERIRVSLEHVRYLASGHPSQQ